MRRKKKITSSFDNEKIEIATEKISISKNILDLIGDAIRLYVCHSSNDWFFAFATQSREQMFS